MSLRFSAILVTGAVLAVSSLAHSTPSAGSAQSSGSGLFQVELILDYCAKVDPASATNYRKALTKITGSEGEIGDTSNPTVAAQTADIKAQLARLPVSTGITACRNFLAGK